jgi:hypothetical protein
MPYLAGVVSLKAAAKIFRAADVEMAVINLTL